MVIECGIPPHVIDLPETLSRFHLAQLARMRTWTASTSSVAGRAGTDPAQFLPALDLCVGAFPGSSLWAWAVLTSLWLVDSGG
jgi:hypothetical protein